MCTWHVYSLVTVLLESLVVEGCTKLALHIDLPLMKCSLLTSIPASTQFVMHVLKDK